MFCAACGSQNPDAGAFCFNCGKALAGFLNESKTNLVVPVGAAANEQMAPPPAVTPRPKQPAPEVERIRHEHPGQIGVGGWLLWFCIMTTIVTPMIDIGSTLSNPSAISVMGLGLTAFVVSTGVNLWKMRPRALRLTKILLAIQFWLGLLLFIAEIAATANESSAGDSRPDSGPFRMLVSSIIWWFYFKKSKRIKATFGRNM